MLNRIRRIKKKIDPEYLSAITRASTMGLHLVSGILMGGVIGYLLDKWLDTKPWLFLFFVIAGILAGFNNVYIDAKRLIKSQNEEDKNKDKDDDKNSST